MGLSQKKFGELLGVSRTMIYSYESGIKTPNNSRIKQLLALGVELSLPCKAEDFFRHENLSTNSGDKAGENNG